VVFRGKIKQYEVFRRTYQRALILKKENPSLVQPDVVAILL
jgi:hypothetical protein